jgi:hypothetical protein
MAVFPVCSPAGDGPEVAAKAPASLQPVIATSLKKVTPSVVSLWHGDAPRSNLSGIIVSKDGLIVTAGHIHCKVGEAVEIHPAGKKTVKGKVLAKLKEPDLALVQITEKGAWPAVEIGSSGTLTDRDPLLALGFGDTGLYGPYGTEPPCYARLGHRCESILPKDGLLPTTVLACAGDSGGPLFDLTGSLVGIASAGEFDATHAGYVPSDVLLQDEGERTWPQRLGCPQKRCSGRGVGSRDRSSPRPGVIKALEPGLRTRHRPNRLGGRKGFAGGYHPGCGHASHLYPTDRGGLRSGPGHPTPARIAARFGEGREGRGGNHGHV